MPDEPHPLHQLLAQLMDGNLTPEVPVPIETPISSGERVAGYIAEINQDIGALRRLVRDRTAAKGRLRRGDAKELLYAATVVVNEKVRQTIVTNPHNAARARIAKHANPDEKDHWDASMHILRNARKQNRALLFAALDFVLVKSLEGGIQKEADALDRSIAGHDFLLAAGDLVQQMGSLAGYADDGTHLFEQFQGLGADTAGQFMSAGLHSIDDYAESQAQSAAQLARDNWGLIAPLTAIHRAHVGKVSLAATPHESPTNRPMGAAYRQPFHIDETNKLRFDTDPLEWEPEIEDPHSVDPFSAMILSVEPTVGCPAAKHVAGKPSLASSVWNTSIDTLISVKRWTPDRPIESSLLR